MATPTYFTMPDLDVALPTRADNGRHAELKMATTKLDVILSLLHHRGNCRLAHYDVVIPVVIFMMKRLTGWPRLVIANRSLLLYYRLHLFQQ